MRKKLISKTYLRDVKKHNLKIIYDDECCYAIKEIKEVKEPFVLTNQLCLIDNGYYMIEIIPQKENYSIRAFFDKNKKLLQYYIDISQENGIDKETRIPYYDDLFTDIIITDGNIEVVDEDELEDALNNGIISQEDYELAFKVKEKLLKEIKENTNKYLQMDLSKLI